MAAPARPPRRFAMTLAQLEASAHVPVERQVEEVDTDPPQVPALTGSQQRAELLRIAGAV